MKWVLLMMDVPEMKLKRPGGKTGSKQSGAFSNKLSGPGDTHRLYKPLVKKINICF